MTKLKGIHYQSLARNMLLQEELGRLLARFNTKGIPVVILKGAALLDVIYRDISLRPMSDLDILVHPKDLNSIEAMVMDMAYVYPTKQTDGSIGAGKRHLPTLINRKKNIFLEVHTHIVNTNDAAYFNIDGFWARAQPVCAANAEALAFSPEDSIIHMGIKFLSDRRYQSNAALGQLCDISEIIKHFSDSLDWNLVATVSRDNGFAAGMYSVLYACQRILGTEVPAETMRQLYPPQFNPDVTDLFFHRRVLDTRKWLAHNLVDHKAEYNRRRMFGAILGRFSRLVVGIFGGSGHSGKRRFFSLIRVKTVILRIFRVLIKPSELKEDLLLDRWLHDLYR